MKKKTSIILIFLVFIIYTQNLYSQHKGTLNITINGFKSDSGMVRVAVFNQKEKKSFPDSAQYAEYKKIIKCTGKETIVKFINVPYGKYAISVHHDKNNNQILEKNKLGIPLETFGISSTKKLMKLPKFEDAVFEINSNLTEIKIQLY